MKLTIPPPNWLRSFEAAGRLKSFTDAAVELGVTPSAVSQQVRLLEQRLGTQLFLRLPKGLELTDHGKSFLPAVQCGFGRSNKPLPSYSTPQVRILLSCASTHPSLIAGWLIVFPISKPPILQFCSGCTLCTGRRRRIGRDCLWKSGMVMASGRGLGLIA